MGGNKYNCCERGVRYPHTHTVKLRSILSEFSLSLSLFLKLRKSMPIEAYTLTQSDRTRVCVFVCVRVLERGP